jgi:HNH endonuclease
MGKNTREQRLKIFDLYAADFALATTDILRVDGSPDGVCVCPICRTGYFRDSVAAMKPGTEPTMDLAHVWPESCGGNLVTLTCKKCNSRIGSKYDSQIARDYAVVAALGGEGAGTINGRIHFDGGSVGVAIKRDQNGFHLNEIAKQTNPEHSKKFLDLPRSGEPLEFKLVWKHPDPMRHSVAILHSAYLAMFRHFGYEYWALGNCYWIRDILTRNDPPDEADYLSIQLDWADHNPMYSLLQMFEPYVVRIEPGLFCMAVPLPSPMPNVVARLVILPGIGPDAVDDYNKVILRHQPDVPTAFTMTVSRTKFPSPETRIGNATMRMFGLWWWQDQVRAFKRG